MIKTIILLFTLLINQIPEQNPVIKDITKQSIAINSVDYCQGSGVLLSPWYVLTCSHVCGKDDIMVYQHIYKNGKYKKRYVSKANIFKIDYDRDIAILQLNQPFGKNFVTLYNENEPPPIGTDVYHVGNVLGHEHIHTLLKGSISFLGRVISINNTNQVMDQLDITVKTGCSGGGVFLQSDGRLIGLITHSNGNNTDIGYMLPAREIVKWFNDNDLKIFVK